MYPGYQVVKRETIEEIGVELTHVVHEKSGAHIVHLGNEDPENLFCLAFQTWPRASDGAPHILEHTVLCGSKKYPVKDPFFGMIRRSLNTFMNAMTGDDITYYPAASCVPNDFYNLLDVYLDAVFHPKLERLSFLQEGHRLEFEVHDDPTTPLHYKGIVFNEMKGSIASSQSRAWYKLVEELYPDTPYRFNSGGDPKVIPQLTYEQLLEFHETFYAPSRCMFFFYGNLPLQQHLEFIEKEVLNDAPKLPSLPKPATQPRFAKSVFVEDSYPATTAEDKSVVMWGWLTTQAHNQEEVLALYVLDLLLTGNDGSPLKAKLLQSKLCEEAYAYVCGDMHDVPFIIQCNGVDKSGLDQLEKIIFSTLEKMAKEGVSDEQLETAIHQLELERLEITGDSVPYGLTLFRRSVPLMQMGAEPTDGLAIVTLFRHLRERFAKPGALAELINKHFLQNPHLVRVHMTPDVERAAKETAVEKETLKEIQTLLTESQKQEIVAQTTALEKFQAKDESDLIDLLPKVELADVATSPPAYPLEQHPCKPLTIHSHDCATNSLVYATLVYDLPQLSDQELAAAQLFAYILPEVGCGGRSYSDNLDYMQRYTGGVGLGLGLYGQIDSPGTYRPAVSIAGKALSTNCDHLFPLMCDMIQSANLQDKARIGELLMQYRSALENGLNSNALRYATSLSLANYTPGARIGYHLSGLGFLEAVRTYSKNVDQAVDDLCALQSKLLGLQNSDLILGCEPSVREMLMDNRFYGLCDLPQQKYEAWSDLGKPMEVESQGRKIGAPVAFTSRALAGLHYTHRDAPLLSIAARLFNHKTLHPIIREKGGAYGGGAVADPASGTFYFYAYRDPHFATTVAAMDEAVERIANGQFNEKDLEAAKLTLIQKIDSPVSPGSRAGIGYTWLRTGKTLQMRTAYRKRLLECKCEEVAQAVADHLKPQMDKSVTVVFANSEFLEGKVGGLPHFET